MTESKDRQKVLTKCMKELQISEYIDYKNFLKKLYQDAKELIPSYSYLLFSEDLGFGKNNSSRLIIIGDRTLTVKAAEKIVTNLQIKGPKKRYFLAMVDFVNNRDANKRDDLYSEMMKCKEKLEKDLVIDSNVLRYIERWYLPILREMTALEEFKNDPKWIQEKLNFPVHLKEIRYAMKSLVELGLVTYDEKNDTYKRTAEKVHSPPELSHMAAVRFHQKMIDLGKDSILRVKQEQREVVAQTIALPLSAVKGLKVKINKLLDEVELLESHKSDSEIFQINVQMFPVTHVGEEN